MADTCKHGYDLDHLTDGQRAAVIENCNLGMIHNEADDPSAPVLDTDALRVAIDAADNWCDYLEENDRTDEIDPIEAALAALRATLTADAGVGKCWRCNLDVTSQVEVVWLDGQGRNDCPESEDGAPHEIEEPE